MNELQKKLDRLEQENRQLDSKILEIYTLYNISKKLNMATQLDEIFVGTMDLIGKTLQIDDFCIMLLEGYGDNQRLVTNAYHGETNLRDISFAKGEGISGQSVMSKEIIICQDVSKKPDFLFYKGIKKNIGSFICIPLIDNNGDVLGVLNAHKPMPNSFNVKDIDLFKEVANQIGVAIEKAISLKNIKELSLVDDLTGIHNRRYFFEFFEKEMERAKRYARPISLIMIDIDNFKNFNDKKGHLEGDKALSEVANSLKNNLRKTDILARYGGEEFIILLPESGKSLSLKVAEKLREAISNKVIEGEEIQPGHKITATFGVSTFPENAEFATELLNCADKALYYGKRTGKNSVTSYDENIV